MVKASSAANALLKAKSPKVKALLKTLKSQKPKKVNCSVVYCSASVAIYPQRNYDIYNTGKCI
jgi:hypothetical protein